MENGPFIDDFPIKTSIYKGLSMAMLNNQMVILFNPCTVNSLHFTIAPLPEVWAMKRRVAPSGAQVPMGGLAPPNQQDMQTTLLTEPQGGDGRHMSPWHKTHGGYPLVI